MGDKSSPFELRCRWITVAQFCSLERAWLFSTTSITIQTSSGSLKSLPLIGVASLMLYERSAVQTLLKPTPRGRRCSPLLSHVSSVPVELEEGAHHRARGGGTRGSPPEVPAPCAPVGTQHVPGSAKLPREPWNAPWLLFQSRTGEVGDAGEVPAPKSC